MGLGETDLLEEQAADDISVSAQTISCSICLEAVSDCGNRSKAKLQCGHEFHLDCIGSAFNAKGLMQCPNCRKIEKGQWLYANGYCSFPEFTVEDWTHDEDIYDLGYSEMPFGVHWCPFTGLSRLPLSFEEGEPPSTEFPDLLGPQAIFTEYMTTSSPGHSGPYVAYLQPVQPSSSASSTESVVDGPFHHHWSSISGLSDIPSSHVFAATDIHYQSWEHHSPTFSPPNSRISAADQTPSTTLRSARPDSDGLPRTGSLGHPFLLGHGSGSRAGNSAVSTVPTYLGNPQIHSRIHGPHAYNQHNSPGVHAPVFSGPRRSNNSRGVPSSSDHSSYYLFPSASSGRSLQDAENSAGSNLYAWERDCFAPYPLPPLERESTWWGPFHQNAGRSNSSSRNNSWHRHGLERSSSQARTENASHPSIHLNQMHPYL